MITANATLLSFQFVPKLRVFEDFPCSMLTRVGTCNRAILKICNLQPTTTTEREADAELIAFGPNSVQTRTKIARFSQLEWHDLQIFMPEATLWCEFRDVPGLIRVLEAGCKAAEAIESVLAFDAADTETFTFKVSLTSERFILQHPMTSTSLSTPLQIYDSAFANEAFRDPGVTAPRVICQFNSGVEQVEALMRRIDRWPDSWSIDVLELRAQIIEDTCVLEWIACTSTPPLVSLKCRLPAAPLVRSTPHRPTTTVTYLNLHSALSSMLRPLQSNEKLLNNNGACLGVMQDGSVCVSLRWNVIAGFGPIMTIIQLPGLNL